MALTLKQSEIEAFIKDPVLAAWSIFGGLELDVAQRVRLRTMWFVPEVHDDSGIYTGKTIVSWIWVQLRCILLPSPRGFAPRIVGVFYQDINSANSVFKPYFKKFIDACPVYRNELSRQHGKTIGYRPFGSGFEYIYKNGNSVFCPAIGMKEDAAKIASLRVHDGFVEEAKEIDLKSDALDNQILSRINADCWNPQHPVWTNHKVLVGHAEDPATHPSYKRHQVSKAKIWDGDQDVAVITSSFRDWTPKFIRFRKDKEIRTARLSMSGAKFSQRYGGLWEYGTEDWYDAKVLEKCRSRRAPLLLRRDPALDEIFTFGWDTAPGGNARSDLNAGFAWRALPVTGPITNTDGLYHAQGRYYQLSPVWGTEIRGRDGGVLSGVIHRQHQRFQFGRLVYDPGGGGLWVAKELWKTLQYFDGAYHQVTGLCQPEQSGSYPEASPLVIKWGKGSVDLAHAWSEEKYLATDDGIVEAIQREAQNLFASRSILWPLAPDKMTTRELEALSPEQRNSLLKIDVAFKQLLGIQVKTLTRNGEEVPLVTRNGFLSFTSRGKKDCAYAALYGLAAMLSLLNDPNFDPGSAQEEECMAFG
jgi:hypothetical protein